MVRYNVGLGEVLEWSNRTVLKTVVQYFCTVGSNPTLSARYLVKLLCYILINKIEHKGFKGVTSQESLNMELIEDLDWCINLFYTV